MTDIWSRALGKIRDDIPDRLSGNPNAGAYYGVLKPFLDGAGLKQKALETVASDTAMAIYGILGKYEKVYFWDDEDAQKQVINKIDDYLFDELKTEKNIDLSLDQMDEIIDKVMQVAKRRSNN